MLDLILELRTAGYVLALDPFRYTDLREQTRGIQRFLFVAAGAGLMRLAGSAGQGSGRCWASHAPQVASVSIAWFVTRLV
jgi:hypothetical protein